MKSRRALVEKNLVYDDLLLLMNSIQDYAIIRLDKAGNITSWNKGAENIKGYTAPEAIGRNFSIFYPAEAIQQGMPQANLQHAKQQGSFSSTGLRVRKDGSTFWADMIITALYADDGNLRGFVKITRDITKQKELSDELERLHLLARQTITEKLDVTLKENLDYKHALDESAIVAITDQKGTIIHVNDNFCKISKYSREELLGRDHRIVNSGYHEKSYIRELWRTIAGGKIWKGELKNKAKDGSYYWVDTTIVPFLDKDGKPYQYLAIRSDITGKKQEESHLRLLESVITNTTDAVLITEATPLEEPGPRIVYVNRAFTEMTGYSPEEVTGKTPRLLQGPKSNKQELQRLHAAMRNLEPCEITTINYRKSGDEFWINFAVSPVMDEKGRHTHFIAIERDVSDRKQSEQLLQQRAKELAVSNADLEQFAYVASHDLQEPLRMITSFLTQLEKKYGSLLDDRGKQYIHFAVDGAKRMRQIILDLLDYSRVGRTEDDLEAVDLNQLVAEVLALYRTQIEEKKARILFKDLPTISIFKAPFRQVLQNLIGNSLKYQKAGESPLIAISAKDCGDRWLITVQDNGIGIDPVYFDKIFVIFQRLHHKDEYPGTGMGLAITKKIVESVGGEIGVTAAEGEGSTFYFTILKKQAS